MSGASLDLLLTRNLRAGTITELFDAFIFDDVEFTLAGMGAVARASSLLNKVRGALGEVLLDSASGARRARSSCTWTQTSAAEVFFGKRPLARLGSHDSELAKPFLLSARASEAHELIITLRVFGLARDRTSALVEAMARALTKVRWADLARDGNWVLPTPIVLADVRCLIARRLECLNFAAHSAVLTFLSKPDADRADIAERHKSLAERLARRLALMAPWFGLAADKVYDSVAGALATTSIETLDYLPTDIEKGGHKMRNQLSAAPSFAISNLSPDVVKVLAIAEKSHIGRGANIGLGRFRLEILDLEDSKFPG